MRIPSVVVLTTALALGTALAAQPALAVQPQQSSVVSSRPVAGPQINDGIVFTITQIGDVVYAGGSFTKVGTLARRGLVAYNTRTHSVVTGFAPQFDGVVRTLLPGPVSGTIYVGGEFGKVSGAPGRSLVLLNATTGARVASFTPPAMNGTVQVVKQANGRLYVGGTFTKLGSAAHGGVATLDPVSGALDGQMSSQVTEHHAWAPDNGYVKGAVGVIDLDVSPDGRQLVAIGNFKKVDGQTRDQVAMWDLSGSRATLRNWSVPRYQAQCSKGFDSYIRDVDISPDGTYFVIVGTGGRHGGSLCDAAARFETGATGLTIQPTWVSSTGADSLLSVAITGETIYVGGHQRWLNNPNGGDTPGPGAVPRPGVAALDPVTGVPLSWNPGRHPRGAGTYVLYATNAGLWIGSDTNKLGHSPTINAQKIGFFPLAGGKPAASKALPAVPGTVYLGTGSGSALSTRQFDGTNASAPSAAGSPFDVSKLRGITTVGNTVFYGKSDGKLYERSLAANGTLGPEAAVDPYNDPFWANRATGSGNTYRGVLPSFYGSELASVTSMFFDGRGNLYYTLAGKSGLYSRAFSPDVERTSGGVTTGGVIYPNRTQVKGVSMPTVTGAFLAANGNLYFAKADGSLNRVAFNGGHPNINSATRVGTGVDWSSRALFLRPSS